MSEREATTFALWRRVNEIACATEDTDTIRKLIAEAGVAPNTHVGTDAEEFTPLMVAEWCLGQWADMIDNQSPWMNSARNISLSQYERVAPDGTSVKWPWPEIAS